MKHWLIVIFALLSGILCMSLDEAAACTISSHCSTTVIKPGGPDIPVPNDSIEIGVESKFMAYASVGMDYNPIGQLGTLALGGNCTLNLTYDVHGWRKSSIVSTPKTSLGETLHYADSSPPRYNGNLSARTLSDHTYHYYYDANNRLTSASCNAHNDESDFSTGYEYDAMSNITALWRMGVIDKAGSEEYYGTLDNIEISYDGNRAVSVSAETDAVTFEGMTGLGLCATNLSIAYAPTKRHRPKYEYRNKI